MRVLCAFVLASMLAASLGCGSDDKKGSAPENPTPPPAGTPGAIGAGKAPPGTGQPPPPPSAMP